ncbi:hypothetical protein ACQ4PT_060592 [Festuca glaucescens]
MEEPRNPGGGAGGQSCYFATGGGGGDHGATRVDDLDELWPSRPSTAAAMLAQVWVDNPAASSRFTSGLGGVDLDPEIWDIRIHFDGVDNIERSIARDDITLMNIVALIEMKGYGFSDSIYCRKDERMGMQLIENNAQIYELLEHFSSDQVLSFTPNIPSDAAVAPGDAAAAPDAPSAPAPARQAPPAPARQAPPAPASQAPAPARQAPAAPRQATEAPRQGPEAHLLLPGQQQCKKKEEKAAMQAVVVTKGQGHGDISTVGMCLKMEEKATMQVATSYFTKNA